MKIEQYRDPRTFETVMVFRISDYELATAPLDKFDRAMIGSPREYPISDALLDAQVIAFRIEQAEANARNKEP